MKETTKVMLIEDNREYRDVISIALEKAEGIVLESQYPNAEVALRKLDENASSRPDVILLDLRLPGMDGIQAIPYIKKISPASKIIMLTQSDSEADVLRAISLGATGYLLKGAKILDILEGIQSVMNGGAPIDPNVAKYILENLQMRMPEVQLKVSLSDRETETLNLLGEGFVKKEIADKLGISYTTVDTHVRHIYEKLHVTNAPSAVSKAYRLGIFTARKNREK